VLSAEEVVVEVEAAEHVKAGAGDADGGDDMVIDGQGEKANTGVELPKSLAI